VYVRGMIFLNRVVFIKGSRGAAFSFVGEKFIGR